MMWGYLGNRILVNGKPNAVLSLEPRAYRLRILNGSNARTYKLAWSNGMPLKVIGTDGGLLPAVGLQELCDADAGRAGRCVGRFQRAGGQAGDPAQPVLRPGGGMMGGGGGGMGGGGMGGGGMGGGGMGGGWHGIRPGQWALPSIS